MHIFCFKKLIKLNINLNFRGIAILADDTEEENEENETCEPTIPTLTEMMT
jgi:hypothetical protein